MSEYDVYVRLPLDVVGDMLDYLAEVRDQEGPCQKEQAEMEVTEVGFDPHCCMACWAAWVDMHLTMAHASKWYAPVSPS